VKDIPVAAYLRPGQRLAGAQPRAAVGHHVVWLQPLRAQLPEINRPCLGIALPFRGQQIAIQRIQVDARQHRTASSGTTHRGCRPVPRTGPGRR
jgi:hypothetical protein